MPVRRLAAELEAQRSAGRRIVHCHGVFDLLHVGHLRHFEEARGLGDVLVVTVTGDAHVNKGPHRPAFPQAVRAELIAALGCVDFVAVNEAATAVEAIDLLRPDVYAKGPDYAAPSADPTGQLAAEARAVRAGGGRIAFTGGETHSSSALINRHVAVLEPATQAWLATFAARHPAAAVLGYLERARGLKVLLVGETIVDEYVYCEALGKSAKAPTMVVRQEEIECFAGGILAAANHVAAFCDEVTVLTQVGAPGPIDEFIAAKLRPNVRPLLLRRAAAPTIVKRRFVESYHFVKFLEVYEIADAPLAAAEDAAVCAALEEQLPRHDLVVVIDFGHAMLGDRARGLVRAGARFLAVNAQSNAGNLGHHPLAKYPGADYLTATETEVRLEARDRHGDIRRLVADVRAALRPARFVVTRGQQGCLCDDGRGSFLELPSVAARVVDRIGAGDAFLAVSSLFAVQDAPPEIVGFAGNAAGALAVASVGNRDPIDALAFRRQVESLLK